MDGQHLFIWVKWRLSKPETARPVVLCQRGGVCDVPTGRAKANAEKAANEAISVTFIVVERDVVFVCVFFGESWMDVVSALPLELAVDKSCGSCS
jgi:hypothetical protein